MGERAVSGASNAGDDSDLMEALSRCRSSLEHQLSALREHGSLQGALEVLRPDVSDFASRSRRLEVPPERLLISFKEMVSDLSAFQGWRATERNALMQQLVHMTIEAYYSDRHDSG